MMMISLTCRQVHHQRLGVAACPGSANANSS